MLHTVPEKKLSFNLVRLVPDTVCRNLFPFHFNNTFMCGKYERNYKRKHFCIVRIRHRTKGDKILGILPRDLLEFLFWPTRKQIS